MHLNASSVSQATLYFAPVVYNDTIKKYEMYLYLHNPEIDSIKISPGQLRTDLFHAFHLHFLADL